MKVQYHRYELLHQCTVLSTVFTHVPDISIRTFPPFMLFVLHDGFVNETNEFHISVEKVHNFTAPDCNTVSCCQIACSVISFHSLFQWCWLYNILWLVVSFSNQLISIFILFSCRDCDCFAVECSQISIVYFMFILSGLSVFYLRIHDYLIFTGVVLCICIGGLIIII